MDETEILNAELEIIMNLSEKLDDDFEQKRIELDDTQRSQVFRYVVIICNAQL